MKKLILGVLICTIYASTNVASAVVIERKTKNGGKNGYSSTSRTFCSTTLPDGSIRTGYCIECTDPGRESCPTSIVKQPNDPASLPDHIDVSQGNFGIQHAITQISAGNFNYNFTDPSGLIRNYVLTWTYSEDANGENINSIIKVDRPN